MLLPLTQHELRDWPYGDEDEADSNADNNSNYSSDSSAATAESTTAPCFRASVDGRGGKTQTDYDGHLQQLTHIITSFAHSDAAGLQLLLGLLLTGPLLRLLFQRQQQRVHGRVLQALLLEPTRPWRGWLLSMAAAWNSTLSALSAFCGTTNEVLLQWVDRRAT